MNIVFSFTPNSVTMSSSKCCQRLKIMALIIQWLTRLKTKQVHQFFPFLFLLTTCFRLFCQNYGMNFFRKKIEVELDSIDKTWILKERADVKSSSMANCLGVWFFFVNVNTTTICVFWRFYLVNQILVDKVPFRINRNLWYHIGER